MQWDTYLPTDWTLGVGNYNPNTNYWEATVTFTGLPRTNDDFGRKDVVVRIVDPDSQSYAALEQRTVEVFFPAQATNHPAGQVGSPNWYHYWSQALGVTGNHTYDPTLPNVPPNNVTYGVTAVASATTWAMRIGPGAFGGVSGGIPPTGQSYINGFWAVNLHENWHRDQRIYNFTTYGVWGVHWTPPGTPPAGALPLSVDPDGDGIDNTWEAMIGTNPNDIPPAYTSTCHRSPEMPPGSVT